MNKSTNKLLYVRGKALFPKSIISIDNILSIGNAYLLFRPDEWPIYSHDLTLRHFWAQRMEDRYIKKSFENIKIDYVLYTCKTKINNKICKTKKKY